MPIISLIKDHTIIQASRFGVVGVVQNLIGYLVYLLLTWKLLSPYLAVMILYPISVLISYFLNRQWTFHYQGEVGGSLARFSLVHLLGLGISLSVLWIFSELLGVPHQLVQAFNIAVVGVMTFALLKIYVYTQK